MPGISTFYFAREIGLWPYALRAVQWQFKKRLMSERVSVLLPTGLILRTPPEFAVASEIFITNCDVDWGGEEVLRKCVSAQSTVFDVGANIGYYSLYFAPLVKSVVAFEFDPVVLPVLRENARRADNVSIIPQPAYDEITDIRYSGGGRTSAHLTVQANDSKALRTTTVDAEWIRLGAPEVSVIKIDAEGSDFKVLLGCAQVIAACAPVVFAELNDSATLAGVFRWATKNRYNVYAHVRDHRGHPKARLKEFGIQDAHRYWKLLYLVPVRHEALFRALC